MDDFDYDESYDELSDGDVADEFALDDIKAEVQTDTASAAAKLREMAGNPQGAYAADAAVELLRIDPSPTSLDILVHALKSGDSYSGVHALDLGWSYFSQGKPEQELIEHLQRTCEVLESQPRLQLRLRCILISVYLSSNQLDAAQLHLQNLLTDISQVTSVWQENMEHEVLVLAAQVHAASAHSSLSDLIALQQKLRMLESGKSSGVVLGAAQKQALNEIRARLCIKHGDLQGARQLLASALEDSEAAHVLLVLVSLCLGQRKLDKKNGMRTKEAIELPQAWIAGDTEVVRELLSKIKTQLNSYQCVLGSDRAVELAWEGYIEQSVLKVLRMYSRIRFSCLYNTLPGLFESIEEMQKVLAVMVRNGKLPTEFRLNVVDESIDRVAVPRWWAPNGYDEDVELPQRYHGIHQAATAEPPHNETYEMLQNVLRQHQAAIESLH